MNKYKVMIKTSWDKIPSYTYLYVTAYDAKLYIGDDVTGNVTYLEVTVGNHTATIEFETHDVTMEKETK